MTIKKIALAAGLSLFTATAGFTATFTIDGDDFDVTTITGTFADNQTLLESQVWWGIPSLAFEFASVVGADLGIPNFTYYGPLFAFSASTTPPNVTTYAFDDFDQFAFPFSRLPSDPVTYAVATPVSPVPLPAGGVLLLTGLGGVAAFKRRKKRSA